MTVRGKLESAIVAAIDALDAFDRDAEAEDDSTAEPSADREEWAQPVTLQWAR